MHDGRATTLTEAILEHASPTAAGDTSEARASRQAFLARSNADKRAVIAFLNNLVLFKIEEEEEEAALALASGAPQVRQVVTIAPPGVKVLLPRGQHRVRSTAPVLDAPETGTTPAGSE